MGRKTVYYELPPEPAQVRQRRGWLAWLFSRTPGPSPTTASLYGKPVVARQPAQQDATRQKRAFDRLADVFNSCGVSGQILQTGPHEWVILPRVFEEPRDPSPADDITFGAWPGTLWVNTASHGCFLCVTNTAGGAVWKSL